MLIQHARDGDIALLKYDRFCVTALLGAWDVKLEEVPWLYEGMEFGRVQQQPGQRLLTGFRTKPPPVDITFVDTGREGSIVAYNIDHYAMDLARVPLGKFRSRKPTQQFIDDREYELIGIQSKTYAYCLELAGKTGQPLESIFGLTHYLHFLIEYNGMDPASAVKKAQEIFKVTIPGF